MESRTVVARSRRNGESVFNRHRVSVWEDGKVLEVHVVMAAQQCGCM
jgi:hypothetical protein